MIAQMAKAHGLDLEELVADLGYLLLVASSTIRAADGEVIEEHRHRLEVVQRVQTRVDQLKAVL